MLQLAPDYRSLLAALLQRLLVSEHITEHPSIYFGIPHRINVLDAMLVLVFPKLFSSKHSAISYFCSSMDFSARAAQAQMNQSSLVRARSSDLPWFALAQDQLGGRCPNTMWMRVGRATAAILKVFASLLKQVSP